MSKLGTDADGREKIEYIDISLIDDDPNNFYELSQLDELAANIELLGLQQPLRVRTNPEDPARVIIVSGSPPAGGDPPAGGQRPERPAGYPLHPGGVGCLGSSTGAAPDLCQQ